MNIVIISDIHGNIDALNSVLKESKNYNIEKYFVLGDVIGYYYNSKEVLDKLRELNAIMIKGNHERMLEEAIDDKKKLQFITKKYGSAHKRIFEEFSNKDLNYILNLPDQKNVTIDGIKIQLNHGCPWNQNFYLYPDTEKEILNSCCKEKYDFVLVGHSHYSFVHTFKKKYLINVGSVGQNRKEGGNAEWLIIDTKSKNFELKSTKYNVNELGKLVKKFDPKLEYNYKILYR